MASHLRGGRTGPKPTKPTRARRRDGMTLALGAAVYMVVLLLILILLLTA
ncbi:MAG: hypothetical protein M3Q71_26025 [Chloroflexota bacterium]|nr:hypothetical protein [Chloroflexota bacterium]MDP9474073.1 hypothetical protein [Chloroflexota bacterium]